MLVTGGLSIDYEDGGVLDVTDGALIVNDAGAEGTWDGSEYTGLTGYIQDGLGYNEDYPGNGITSSFAGLPLRGLGIGTGADTLFLSGTQTGLFHGETVTASSVLIRFTYGGDANMDGKLNGDDYARIDTYIGQSGSVFGFAKGDVNYDGQITIDDYAVIDGTIGAAAQGVLEPNSTRLYYSSQGQVVEERQAGQTTAQYVWSPRYVNALVEHDSGADANSDHIPDTRYYALQDANYNTTAVANTSGDNPIVERYQYDPYGTVTFEDASGTPISGNTSAIGWKVLYQGGRIDPTTNLYFFNSGGMGRDYSTTLGRWIEQDPNPFGPYADGMNRYQIERNDPILRTDPSGQISQNNIRHFDPPVDTHVPCSSDDENKHVYKIPTPPPPGFPLPTVTEHNTYSVPCGCKREFGSWAILMMQCDIQTTTTYGGGSLIETQCIGGTVHILAVNAESVTITRKLVCGPCGHNNGEGNHPTANA